mmetsp:Transcript_32866/g.69153  ORF Transcript_32866/g.69153 Transcript_32866/m.69153 type:complete len:264 (-) Transcript_32866:105-896(-)|eukprot:CAMPEP_0172321902 /NCGR_PEP_ID=MMETSP1058-20130122/44600_1 /TAXON_ID=83371 /ORGANISM="Detonula confervacea, Strain CCMP 353" /LENGTH=263 /DNA_ID=CAMNT_0013037513 /DNA_START=86 /DNA_END=877 /DNA_ORIENTATION=-
MAPIIAPTASSDSVEGPNINVNETFMSKEKLGGYCTDALLVATEGRDDEGDDAAQPEDGDSFLNQADESNVGIRQSNLFADEKKVNELYHVVVEPLPQCTTVPELSLMQSFSPTSASSGGALEDVDISMQPFDDFAIGIMSQIDADEELARQLQDEEDKKKQQQSKPKANAKVVPSLFESFLGEPFPMEVRSNYTRVSDSSSSGTDVSGSVSGSISMLTTSFKKWGNNISTAATDFFGEDIGFQVRSSSSSQGGSRSQYRNAV